MEPIQPIETPQLLDEAITTARKWEAPLGKAKKGKAEKAFEALRKGQVKLDNPQARIQRLNIEDFELEGLQLLPDIKKSMLDEDGYAFYLLTVPVLVFPGRGAQYRLLESQFTFDVEQGQRPLAIQNAFPGPSWEPVLDWGDRFTLALDAQLEWGMGIEMGPDFAHRMQLIRHNLDIGGYTIVARECAGLMEYALRQLLFELVNRLKPEDQAKMKELTERFSRGGHFTMGRLVRLFRDSHFLDAWARISDKDLTSFRTINLDGVRQLRNDLIHEKKQKVTRDEAELLVKYVRIMFETFEINPEQSVSPELNKQIAPSQQMDALQTKIAELGGKLANRVGSQYQLSGFMGVAPFECNLRKMDIDAAVSASTAAWRLNSKGNICNRANMQFVILPKVPKEVHQIKVEAAAQAEPSFKWLTEQVSHVFDRLPQTIQQIIRGRKGLPLQDFQTWRLDLPK